MIMMITTVCLNDHEDRNNFLGTWTSAAWGTLALRAPVIIWTEDTGADKENTFVFGICVFPRILVLIISPTGVNAIPVIMSWKESVSTSMNVNFI